MPEWQPIETAPKDGSLVLCCWDAKWWEHHERMSYGAEYGEVVLLRWKYNTRIPAKGEYFGDPVESDDYEISEPENQPTHWLPIPNLP